MNNLFCKHSYIGYLACLALALEQKNGYLFTKFWRSKVKLNPPRLFWMFKDLFLR